MSGRQGGAWKRVMSLGLTGILCAAAPALGGMAELGRSLDGSDKAGGGGSTQLRLNPLTNAVDPTAVDQSMDSILDAWAQEINDPANDRFSSFTASHQAGTNHITLKRVAGGRDVDVEIRNTDGGVERGKVERSGSRGRIFKTDPPAGDGVVTVTANGVTAQVGSARCEDGAGLSQGEDCDVGNGNADCTNPLFPICAARTSLDLLAELADRLTAAGCPAEFISSQELVLIQRTPDVEWDDTDSGITTWAISVAEREDIPTLSPWGLVFLLAVLGATALLLLRRRTKLLTA